MIVKVINNDGSSKMVLINGQMDTHDVCMMLAEKNHQSLDPNWTLMERLEDFELCNIICIFVLVLITLLMFYYTYVALERTLEDHENVVEALSHWPKVHHNTLHFRYNHDKYLLLTKPQVLCLLTVFITTYINTVSLVIRCWCLIRIHYHLSKEPVTSMKG